MTLSVNDKLRLQAPRTGIEKPKFETNLPIAESEWTAFHLNHALSNTELRFDSFASLQRLEAAGFVETRGSVSVRADPGRQSGSNRLTLFALKDE